MPTGKLKRISDQSVDIHNKYLALRNNSVPFPPESVAFWCFLLSLQKELGVAGDLLELGVQHGGTAFLSMLACSAQEKQILIDIVKTDKFKEKFISLERSLADRVTFIEASTSSPKTDWVCSGKYRLVHIDAGHTYSAVKDDLERYGPLVTDGGIVCCDDFFTNRWPDVTMAILDGYEAAGLMPVALVNRKAYFSKAEDASFIRTTLKATIQAILPFGQPKIFDVTLRGQPLWYFQIAVSSHVGLKVL